MDTNKVFTKGFSNPDTMHLYKLSDIDGRIQCGGCSFYAQFNLDYGLCCYRRSRYYLETVFEHFGCDRHVSESWQSHSFTDKSHLLINRSYLFSFVRSCKRAIDGRKGIGLKSEELQKLYLDMTDILGKRPPSLD